jgi:hypothetical protein
MRKPSCVEFNAMQKHCKMGVAEGFERKMAR